MNVKTLEELKKGFEEKKQAYLSASYKDPRRWAELMTLHAKIQQIESEQEGKR